MKLGELIMEVYDTYGGRNAEAFVWFAIHGHPVLSPARSHSFPGARRPMELQALQKPIRRQGPTQ